MVGVRARDILTRQDEACAPVEPGTHQCELREQEHYGHRPGGNRTARQRAYAGRDYQDQGEDDLRGVERAENQAANAEPNLDGDSGGVELQRRLQERNGQDHADPDEQHGGDDSHGDDHVNALGTEFRNSGGIVYSSMNC